jgi:hypothetical protein
MSQLPDQHEQIRLLHADFIRKVVQTCSNADRNNELETLLEGAAQQGWGSLVIAVRRIAAGERDESVFGGLDEEDQVIAQAIVRGLQDPSTLPDPQARPDATLGAPGLAHMIHAAATGNAQALMLIGNMAEMGAATLAMDLDTTHAQGQVLLGAYRLLCSGLPEAGPATTGIVLGI